MISFFCHDFAYVGVVKLIVIGCLDFFYLGDIDLIAVAVRHHIIYIITGVEHPSLPCGDIVNAHAGIEIIASHSRIITHRVLNNSLSTDI